MNVRCLVAGELVGADDDSVRDLEGAEVALLLRLLVGA